MNLDLLTVASARTAVLEKETTATALVDAFYAKIAAEDGAIGAYLTLSKERAYRQAAASTRLPTRATLCLRWLGFRSRSKTFSPPKMFAPQRARKSWKTLLRLTMRRW